MEANTWRGPFRVKRGGRRQWVIVNRAGVIERTGYALRSVASQVCRLMNQARPERG